MFVCKFEYYIQKIYDKVKISEHIENIYLKRSANAPLKRIKKGKGMPNYIAAN